MTPERWKQIDRLLQTALDCDSHTRRAFLNQACEGDADLRRHIEALLDADGQAAVFLETPASEAARRLSSDDQASLMIGRRIGQYVLLDEIGRGGMGAVYLAARADHEYEKRVAIKLVKRGMDTDAILRRFRNERQILATLDHPNIAKLLDGGTTSDGLPYFVMDHVDGLPVNIYCDAHNLPTVGRLRVFQTICCAVQHAHSHGVVHRDLKPSNILVGDDGVPKLLDFGIAKLLNSDSSFDVTESTLAPRFITLDYASPEQLRGETITPASDVYSLGVLLYELLTGHQPFSGPPLEELDQRAREEQPEKPSAVIGRTHREHHPDGTHVLTPESVSKTRNGRPETLRRSLRGDIDSIVLTALRKDARDRYATVAQFSDDLRRHLEGRPIRARERTLRCRTARFVQRHKLRPIAAALSVAVFAALIGTELRRLRPKGVTDHAGAALSGDEIPRLATRFAPNEKAYQAYLKGRYFWSKRTGESFKTAIKYFQEAIDADPKYALAYSGLADSYNALAVYGEMPPREAFPKGKAAAVNALRIDDSLAEPHASLAWASLIFDWNWPRAETEFKRALQLDVEYAPAHYWYDLYLSAMGRLDAAAAEAKHALDLDPLSLIANVNGGLVSYYSRQFGASVDQFTKSLELEPNFAEAHRRLGQAYLQQRMYEKAVDEFQRGIVLSHESHAYLAFLGHAYAVSGRTDRARGILQRLKDLSATRYVDPYEIATIYVGLGEKDHAFEWLQRANEERSWWLTFLKVEPMLDTLRSDPRFTSLLVRVGLPL